MKAVYVWSIPLDYDAEPATLAKLLHEDERERAARFHFAHDARRYTVGRAMLRLILSHYTNLPPAALRFTYSTYGKPALAAEQNLRHLEFNLTHTGAHALCAVTYSHAVGIDLEAMRALDYLQLAKTVFSIHEQRALERLPVTQHAVAFFNGWTRKEAYIKAHGQGLSMPLANFDVTLAPDEPARLLATRPDAAEAGRWSLFGWSAGADRIAALAVAGQDWCLVQRKVSELL